MIRIVIVDDHVLFREGLAAIIGAEADIEIAGLAGTVQEAVETARTEKPDLILMDFGLPDGTGVDATRIILSELPETKIIFLTVYEDDENLFAGIRSGAKGYLLKNMRPSKLIASLKSVYQGESALSRSMTLRLMEELSRTQRVEADEVDGLSKLTVREREVLRELASGATNREISQHLFLSENTVKHHIHSILEKINMPDRRAASNYARLHGLVKGNGNERNG
jgi:DNA-binding NarL/FixJ family response regulator